MIHRCPPDWRGNKSLPLLCLNDPSLTDNPHLLDLPVYSLATNQSYANIYCAQCHFDTSNLAKWNVSVECTGSLESYVYNKQNIWILFNLIKKVISTNFPDCHFRLNVTRETVLMPSHYKHGFREWALNHNQMKISCYMIVEQFRRYNQYIEVNSNQKIRKNSHHSKLHQDT